MFPRTFLTFLAIGAFSVNALSTPVVRGPAPEPDFQDVETRAVFEPEEFVVRLYHPTITPTPHKDHKHKHKRFFGAIVGAELTHRQRGEKKREHHLKR